MVETTKKPAFLGQAMLIVLPVLVLLLVGLTSLRQDKILAHREAAQSAGRLAEVVRAESAATIDSTRAKAQDAVLPAFQVDAAGHLLFPPPRCAEIDAEAAARFGTHQGTAPLMARGTSERSTRQRPCRNHRGLAGISIARASG